MARLRKKFRHRWLKETIQISDDRVLPGMVATFYYSAPKIFDRNPNCLVTHVDDRFIYGFNLNYVQSNTFTDIIRRLITVVPVALENNVQASKHMYDCKWQVNFHHLRLEGNFFTKD